MSKDTIKDLTCRVLPQSYDLYINGSIDESTLIDFKKDVNEKLDDIEEIVGELEKTVASLNIGVETLKTTLPEFNIHLSTYGGEVYAGLGIYDIISHLVKTYTVNVYCSGYIMSMGIPIMLAGTNVFAFENTTFMIHEISSLSYGKLTEIKEDVKEAERLNKIIKNIIIEKSKITKAEIDDWYSHKSDVFMTAKEALKNGLIKEII